MDVLTTQDSFDTLHEKSTPVLKEEFPAFRTVSKTMADRVLQRNGLGLAAPQVGIKKRFFVIKTSDTTCQAFFNPVITKYGKEKVPSEEQCFSCPGVKVEVNRYSKIKVRYLTSSGIPKEETLRGLLAIVFQHELDHLNGILILDRFKGSLISNA